MHGYFISQTMFQDCEENICLSVYVLVLGLLILYVYFVPSMADLAKSLLAEIARHVVVVGKPLNLVEESDVKEFIGKGQVRQFCII